MNPYEVLGVPENASLGMIRKAYHRLALRNHPDKNPGDPGAQERMQQINQAYEILNSPEKRRQFDQSTRQKSQDMDGQRRQHQQSQQQRMQAIDANPSGPQAPTPWKRAVPTPQSQQPQSPTPWKRSVPTRQGPAPIPPRPGSPGLQQARQQTFQGVRNRQPQTPQPGVQGPGAAAENPQSARMQAFIALLGMTKFGREVLEKAERFRQLHEIMKAIFGGKPGRQGPYDPSLQQRQAQLAQRFDQHKLQRVQQLVDQKQHIGAPGGAKPGPVWSQREVGQQQRPGGPAIGQARARRVEQAPTPKAPGRGKAGPQIGAQRQRATPKPETATPGQKPMPGSEQQKVKDLVVKKGPSVDL